MEKVGIYRIICNANNKIYVGSSSNIHQRWYKHKSNLKSNKSNPNLQNSYNKYGIKSLIFEVIEYCCIEELIEREKYHAQIHKEMGYELFNVGDFIESPTRGTKLSENHLQKLKNAFAGTKNPSFGKVWVHKDTDRKYIKAEEWSNYEKIGYLKGLSQEHKLEISKKQKLIGRKMSEKNKKKLSEVNKMPKTQEHKEKLSKVRIEKLGVKVLCVETNEEFDSLKNAALKFQTNYQGIRQAISRGGTCCNYHFKKI